LKNKKKSDILVENA